MPPIRPAHPDDAEPLARLIDMAGEGLGSFLWAQSAGPGQTAWDVGRERALRETGGFSYRNAHVIEAEGAVAGMLLGYVQPDPYDTGDLAALPDIIRPLVELEALAPGSWYVNGLAVFPRFEGRGFGSALLALADRLAAQTGCPNLSLIVAEENARARGLYERRGYVGRARLPLAPFDGCPHGGDWLLMVKPLG